MTDRENHERGRFEGQVLEALAELKADVKSIFEQLRQLNGRILQHAERLSATEARTKAITWILGSLFTILAGIIGGIVYLVVE